MTETSKNMIELIGQSYSQKEAEKVEQFFPDDNSRRVLQDAGLEVLRSFPYIPGACVMMSALWTAFIRDNKDNNYPIHAVAGTLSIDGNMVFGKTVLPSQTAKAFSGINMDWDGHCWVQFGNLIADVSIFRTAYSAGSSPLLKEKIYSSFGENRGLLIAESAFLENLGIEYKPHYVLKDIEITGLVRGTFETYITPEQT